MKAYTKLKNISLVAKHFKTTRKTIRKILQRHETLKEEGLKDLSKRPKTSPNKTPPHIELTIITERKKNCKVT
ncbi:MAG: helix-turn-helix domain-containing protein [Thermodesulfovibrionales bacterium]